MVEINGDSNGFLIEVKGRAPLRVNFGTQIVQSFLPEPVGKDAEYHDPEPHLKNAPAEKVVLPVGGQPFPERVRLYSLNRSRRRNIINECCKNQVYPW